MYFKNYTESNSIKLKYASGDRVNKHVLYDVIIYDNLKMLAVKHFLSWMNWKPAIQIQNNYTDQKLKFWSVCENNTFQCAAILCVVRELKIKNEEGDKTLVRLFIKHPPYH